MRYEIRWCNGHWVVFDTLNYEPVRFAGTRKEIDRIFEFG